MPNRILRDWTDSESVDKLSADAERFFTRLIMKVDDYGRYPANPQLIKSNLYPLKSDIRATDISLWLAACKKNGLVTTYLVATKEYLRIENFKQRLRIMESKYPSPTDDGQMTVTCQTDDGLKRNETKQKRNETNARDGKFGNCVLFELSEINEKLSFDQAWVEAAAMNHRVDMPVIQKAISEFVMHLAASGEKTKGLKDAKSHFNNWFKFRKEDNSKLPKKELSKEKVPL